MKKGIAISFGSLIFSIASAASATVAYSTSVKYVDEGGAVVGQTITFCSSASYAGGNVHTAYHISERVKCGDSGTVHYIVPGTNIIAYTLPSFVTIGQICGPAQCGEQGQMPDEMVGVPWTYAPY